MDISSFNFLTQKNGAAVIEVSSCKANCSKDSLLNSDRSTWVSEAGLPQYITVDINNLKSGSDFKYFGWHCWHSYSSNPAIVDLMISSDYTTYRRWSTFQASTSSGFQIFSIPTIPRYSKSLKIAIRENFGAENTYINQIFLLENLQKPEPKPKTTDESFGSLSEISYNTFDEKKTNFFNKNPKSKLKIQLDDLDNTISAIKARHEESKDSLILSEEIDDWRKKMHEISSNLSTLVEKVAFVETHAKQSADKNKIREFKNEILAEIKKKRQTRKKTKPKILKTPTLESLNKLSKYNF